MSEQSQGDGWWRAADGLWYPPEQHPDVDPTIDTSEGSPRRLTRADFRASQEAARKTNRFSGWPIPVLLGALVLFLVVGAGVLAAISNGDHAEDAELRPAEEIHEQEARMNATIGVIGEPAALGDGLLVTVDSIEQETNSDGVRSDRYAVVLRTENTSDAELANPNITIHCSNSTRGGSWYADSTFDMYGSLPPDTFSEGTVLLGLPDDDTGEPTDCDDPVVSIDPILFFGEAHRIDYPVE